VPDLWFEQGGSGAPTLLLLHGLGCNGHVWERFKPFLREWPGRWLIPDLRGHGRSPHGAPYAYGTHAADVAALVQGDDELVVLGHSMGGAVGIALASGWFGVRVRSVVAFGVKIRWTVEELEKLRSVARAPVRWFDTEAQAIERYLKVSGLLGLVEPDSPVARSGVREDNGRYRLAADARINSAAGPAVADLVAAAKAPIRFAAGTQDAMVTRDHMQAFDADAVMFEGAGHNVHVEQPDALWRLLIKTS
jgi:pimeloyl-ACP methyl ester carboxylesterase